MISLDVQFLSSDAVTTTRTGVPGLTPSNLKKPSFPVTILRRWFGSCKTTFAFGTVLPVISSTVPAIDALCGPWGGTCCATPRVSAHRTEKRTHADLRIAEA